MCSCIFTYNVLPKKRRSLQRAHRLRRSINIAEDDVGLAAHLGGLEGDDVEDDAVGGEEHVEVSLEVGLGELVGEVADVEAGECQ